MKKSIGWTWIPWMALGALVACAGPAPIDGVDPVVHVERLDEASSTVGTIWYRNVGGYDYGLPTAMLEQEGRKLFKSDAAFRAHFGTAPPSGIDWATEWLVFYTPGNLNLVRGSWATIKSVRLSSTGKTVSITTRHTLPGDCTPGATRPYVLAAFTAPSPAPTYTRFYRSDFTKSCGEGVTEYDGVAFTTTQEAAALTAANHATVEELGAVGITGSPKNLIIAGRTWSSLGQVAGTTGIGAATMEKLRTLSAQFTGSPPDPEPTPSPAAGTYDGVPFTAQEATAALGAANQATETELGSAGISGTQKNIIINGRTWLTLSSLAATSGIGATTMEKLRTLGGQLGGSPPAPEPEPTGPVAGTYDGVVYSLEQATWALTLVNEESEGVLTGEVGLDSRAVTSILNARPVRSMEHLASLYYVATAGLERLRDYVTSRHAEPKRCRGNGECSGDQRCIGIPTDGSSEYGYCRNLTSVAGEGNTCTSESDCGSGLFCAGITRWSEGTCNPDWMKGRFENITRRYIAEVTDQPVATGVTVTGLASVPVDVVLELDIAHSNPSSLRITLVDPNGQEAVAWDGPTQGGSIPARLVVRGISGDDQVNGRWLLRIWNAQSRGTGNLIGWTLELTSRWD